MAMFGKKETDFFGLFEEGISYSLKAADKLKSAFADGVVNKDELKQLKEIEHDGDKHVHRCLKLIDAAFITPIDRSDIIEIVKQIENVTDSIDCIGNHIYMMHIDAVDEITQKFIQLIHESCSKLVELMRALKSFKKNIGKIKEYIVEVNRIEEDGDKLFIEAMRGLFRPGIDAIKIIKYKELYERLEDSLDKCEDVADIIEKIMISAT